MTPQRSSTWHWLSATSSQFSFNQIAVIDRRRVHPAWMLPLLLLWTLPIAVQAQFKFATNNGAITITAYTGAIRSDAIIPSSTNGLPVTSIGYRAFFSAWLNSVTIPSSVTNIGDRAFYHVILPSVTIPDSVISIGTNAFEDCPYLTNVTIGSSVTSLPASAFASCIKLPRITIPSGITNISANTFQNCYSLTAITVDPQNLTYSSLDGVLLNETQTELLQCPEGKAGSYTVPAGVITIGTGAFFYCTNLTGVTIPDSVTDIGDSAFDNCSGLTSVTIPNSVTSIGDGAFANCSSLTGVTIPNSVPNIGDSAFFNCSGLTSVTIPNSVTNIGAYAFYYCSGLTNVTIGNSVTSIEDHAFVYCTRLTSVTIPGSVTSISGSPFYDCTSLAAISVDASNSMYSSVGGVLFDKSQTVLIECPAGKVGLFTIPDSVTSIEAHAFDYCTRLTSVTIPNSVTIIGDYAFAYCGSLAGVYFEGSPPAVGPNAFWYCPATVYYLPGTATWGSNFGGRPTAPWLLPYPLILNNSFAMQTNGFGFIISWATNTSVVVEACTALANPTWSPVGTNTLIDGWSSVVSSK
jgi:hypothetical protein